MSQASRLKTATTRAAAARPAPDAFGSFAVRRRARRARMRAGMAGMAKSTSESRAKSKAPSPALPPPADGVRAGVEGFGPLGALAGLASLVVVDGDAGA